MRFSQSLVLTVIQRVSIFKLNWLISLICVYYDKINKKYLKQELPKNSKLTEHRQWGIKAYLIVIQDSKSQDSVDIPRWFMIVVAGNWSTISTSTSEVKSALLNNATLDTNTCYLVGAMRGIRRYIKSYWKRNSEADILIISVVSTYQLFYQAKGWYIQ